jgi:hypothetical protein
VSTLIHMHARMEGKYKRTGTMTSKTVRASTGSRKLASGKSVERIVGKNGRALLSFAGCNEVLNLCVVANGYHTRGEDIPGTPRYRVRHRLKKVAAVLVVGRDSGRGRNKLGLL